MTTRGAAEEGIAMFSYGRLLRRAGVTGALIAVTSLMLTACGGGGGSSSEPEPSDAIYQEYYAKLSPAVAALNEGIPKLDASGGQEGAALSATLRDYDAALISFADAIDKFVAPGQARSPHKTFTTQSREIAKVFDGLQARLALPSHTPTTDELTVSIGGSGAVVQWVAACQRLQNLAREKGVVVDYKCATTLGIGTTSTN
jgi:hypothetical protein